MTEIDLSAEEENLTFTRGDTFIWSRILKNSAGAVIDITGRTYKLTVNSDSNPSNEDNQIFEVDGTVSVGTDGEVKFQFTTANWTAFVTAMGQPPKVAFYDMQETTSGNDRTLRKGKFTVKQDINK